LSPPHQVGPYPKSVYIEVQFDSFEMSLIKFDIQEEEAEVYEIVGEGEELPD